MPFKWLFACVSMVARFQIFTGSMKRIQYLSFQYSLKVTFSFYNKNILPNCAVHWNLNTPKSYEQYRNILLTNENVPFFSKAINSFKQQNLGQKFGASKMHLSHPVASAAVHSKVVILLLFLLTLFVEVLCWPLFCYAALTVLSSLAIILLRKRELDAFL